MDVVAQYGAWSIASGSINATISGTVVTSISGQSVVTTASGIGLSGMPPHTFTLASGSINSGQLGAAMLAPGMFLASGTLIMVSGQPAMLRLTQKGQLQIAIYDPDTEIFAEVIPLGDLLGVNVNALTTIGVNYAWNGAVFSRVFMSQSGKNSIAIGTSGFSDVAIHGSVDVSGSVTIISGVVTLLNTGVTISGNVTTLSGSLASVYQIAPTLLRTRKGMPVTSASGGEVLQSGDCMSVTVRYHPMASSGAGGASGYVYVGYDGAGDRPVAVSGFPTSSWGHMLTPGDGITLPISNFNLVRVVATLSGDVVTYIGSQK